MQVASCLKKIMYMYLFQQPVVNHMLKPHVENLKTTDNLAPAGKRTATSAKEHCCSCRILLNIPPASCQHFITDDVNFRDTYPTTAVGKAF